MDWLYWDREEKLTSYAGTERTIDWLYWEKGEMTGFTGTEEKWTGYTVAEEKWTGCTGTVRRNGLVILVILVLRMYARIILNV